MLSSFRFILPNTPLTASSSNNGDDDMLPTLTKNTAPCANCSSAQQACIIRPPYSRSLCRKCARERRNECPLHMSRIDAMIWKQLDRESKLAGVNDIQDTILNVPTAVLVEGSSNDEATTTYSLPNMLPEVTIQQDQNAEMDTRDTQAFQLPTSAEDFRLHSVEGGVFTLGQIPWVMHAENEHVHAPFQLFEFQPASVSVTDGALIRGPTNGGAQPTFDQLSLGQDPNILFATNENFDQGVSEPCAIDQYLNAVPSFR